MSSRILSLKDKELWSEYIKKLPINLQDVYYTPEYYSLYENNGDGDALCFLYEDGEEIVLYPFLKNSINKLGYKLDKEYYDIQGAYGYNGIVTSSKDGKFMERFHNEFTQFCVDNNIIAEFTRFHPLLRNQILASKGMKIVDDRNTVSMDLSVSQNEIWMNEIDIKNRNSIKKAIKKGLNFYADFDYQYYNDFICMYQTTMHKLNADKYYYFTDNYFDSLFDSLRGHSFLGNVFYEDTLVASAIFMYYGKYGHYHLSGSNKDYLNLCPNNLLIYGASLELKQLGVKEFHLGGGTTSDPNDSLFTFKAGFGIKNNVFSFGKRIYNNNIYSDIVQQWGNNYPESYEKNKAKLLGYRVI